MDRPRRLRKNRGHGPSPLRKPLLSIQEQEPLTTPPPQNFPSRRPPPERLIGYADGEERGGEGVGAGTSLPLSANRYEIAAKSTGARLVRYAPRRGT